MTNTIQPSDWQWFGHAGHFICAQWCRFHLCTKVGDYLVSTVGEYVPDAQVREILANSRGIVLEGRGDYRLADYMNKIGFEKLGAWGTYETMVFKAGTPCTSKDCNCGLPTIDGSELAASRYDSARDAALGHYEFCRKAAKGEIDDKAA